jgi:MFS family permease
MSNADEEGREVIARPGARWRWFLALWVSQTLSMTAGGLTSFALGIWVLQRSGSATEFALMSVATTLPSVVCLPLAGVVADRWGNQRALVASDIVAGGVGLVLVALFACDAASTGSLYALLALAALASALHWPAYTSATTALVGPERVARAAALMQFGYVGHQVLAPALAGGLLVIIGVNGVLAIDVASFALAALVAALVRIPAQRVAASVDRGRSVVHDLRAAASLVRSLGLLPLAGYVALTYLPGGFVVALSTPLVLSIASPATVGIVSSVMGLGMVCGGVLSAFVAKSRGGVRRLIRFDIAMAVAMLTAGLAASPTLIAAAGFLFLFGLAGHMSEEQAVWQARVPAEAQGRVFALKRMLTWASLPVSYALAGPLADHVFEPLLALGGPLAPSLGPIIGVGPGRGMALLLMCAGLVKFAIAVIASRQRSLSALDHPIA